MWHFCPLYRILTCRTRVVRNSETTQVRICPLRCGDVACVRISSAFVIMAKGGIFLAVDASGADLSR